MSEETFFLITAIIFIILISVIFFFSLTIIIIIISNWDSQCRSITNLLTCNSCAVLLFHAVAVLIEIPLLFNTNNHPIDTVFCKIRAFLYLCSCSALINSYLIQAISRYFVTIHHTRRIFLTFRINIIMIIFNWVISMIAPSFLLISPYAYQYEFESRLCILTSKVFVTSFTALIMVFVIPTTIIFFLYGSILWHITCHGQIQLRHILNIRTKRNIKIFKNIIILLINIAIGGMPYFLLVIINDIIQVPQSFYLISILILSASVSIESLTLFFTNKDVKTIFYRRIRCQRQTIQTPVVQYIATIRTNQIQIMPVIK